MAQWEGVIQKMNQLDRLNLIDKIARQLQEKMTTTDINTYLGGFDIENDGTEMASSKWVYSKKLLSSADDAIIIKIASELDLEIPVSVSTSSFQMKEFLDGTAYIHARNDFERALQNLDPDPATSIGMACTTLESICKAILDAFEEPYPKDESLSSLQKAVFNKMSLSPDQHADPDIKRILGGLINVGAGIGTLRTKYSTFHGKGQKQRRLIKRHARLAVNSLSAVGFFLIETYDEIHSKAELEK